MAIEYLLAKHSLIYSVYYRANHGWARNNFHNRSSQTAGKCYFEFDFATNRAILLIVEAEFKDSLLDIPLYSESTIRPTIVAPKRKFFQIEALRIRQ